jgi:hypothetical protein
MFGSGSEQRDMILFLSRITYAGFSDFYKKNRKEDSEQIKYMNHRFESAPLPNPCNIMITRTILIATSLILSYCRGFAQGFIITGSSNFYVSSGTTVNLNNLVLVPSAGYNMTNNNIALNSSVSNLYTGGPPISRSYLFSNIPPAFSGAISIYYLTSELNGLSPATLQLNGYSTLWSHYPTTAGTNVATASGLSSITFSELTLASSFSPLPITWISFSGSSVQGMNMLNWTTADEVNCRSYQVSKSTDGIQWQMIGPVIKALNGAGLNEYSWTDSTVETAQSFYRIRQTDYAGDYTYCKIVVLSSTANATLMVYPNPTSDGILVSSGDASLNISQLRLYDSDGELLTEAANLAVARYSLPMRQLTSGIYYLSVILSNGRTATKTIFKK